jgi:hypothetical protein
MKRLNILKKLKYQLPRNTINTLYLSMIRSLMEYGIVLYFGLVTVLTQRLVHIQYQAAIICTGAIKNSSYEKLLFELGWPSISERARSLKLTLLTRHWTVWLHHVSPIYSSRNMLPLIVINIRRLPVIIPPFCRTKRANSAFIPSSCRMWNTLPAEL